MYCTLGWANKSAAVETFNWVVEYTPITLPSILDKLPVTTKPSWLNVTVGVPTKSISQSGSTTYTL